MNSNIIFCCWRKSTQGAHLRNFLWKRIYLIYLKVGVFCCSSVNRILWKRIYLIYLRQACFVVPLLIGFYGNGFIWFIWRLARYGGLLSDSTFFPINQIVLLKWLVIFSDKSVSIISSLQNVRRIWISINSSD